MALRQPRARLGLAAGAKTGLSKDFKRQPFHGAVAQLLTMPDDGIASVRKLIDDARHSIFFKVFELQSGEIIAALLAAKARGVDVQVLLNQVRSSGERPNDATLASLEQAGIAVTWASPHFLVTHEKSLVIDGRRVLISTFNFSEKYFSRTRDYGLVIEDADVVAEVTRCFMADKIGAVFEPPEGGAIAWGNVTARHAVADFIDAAEKQLLIQHPKFHDSAILDRVLDACARGVTVHYLCGGRHGIENDALIETYSNQRILARAGVKLRKQRHLKLHAKLLLADGKRAMLGSMNIDRDAYDIRRELGIVFDDKAAVTKLGERFAGDWHEAKSYEAPDPMTLDLDTAFDPEAEDEAALDHE